MTGRSRLNEVFVANQRHYELPNGQTVPSVTTFLNVLPKPALDKWKLKTVAAWAYDHRDAWKDLPRDPAIDLIKDAAWYDTTARDNGDIAHRILELKAHGMSNEEINIPPGFQGAADTWDALVEEFDVKVLYIEPQLINYSLGYSGSADLIVELNGEIAIIDHKSGNGLYGSTAFQLTAYAMCEFVATPEGEIPMPEVTRTYGLWARPEGYALYPMEFSDDTWDVVRASRKIFDLTKQDWKYRGKPVNTHPIRKAERAWGDAAA